MRPTGIRMNLAHHRQRCAGGKVRPSRRDAHEFRPHAFQDVCYNAALQFCAPGARRPMKCPFCREGDFAVVDSRNQEGNFPIRRRRVCDHCKRKVWTIERIEEVLLHVIKKHDGRHEPFDPDKLAPGPGKSLLQAANHRRPARFDDPADRERNSCVLLRRGPCPRHWRSCHGAPPATWIRWPTSASPQCIASSPTPTISWRGETHAAEEWQPARPETVEG